VSPNAIHLDPDAIYDDDHLFVVLGVTARTLSKARQSQQLRFSRKGQRILYLGRWIFDWLERDSALHNEREAVQ
jgi:hypothetical protein